MPTNIHTYTHRTVGRSENPGGGTSDVIICWDRGNWSAQNLGEPCPLGPLFTPMAPTALIHTYTGLIKGKCGMNHLRLPAISFVICTPPCLCVILTYYLESRLRSLYNMRRCSYMCVHTMIVVFWCQNLTKGAFHKGSDFWAHFEFETDSKSEDATVSFKKVLSK